MPPPIRRITVIIWIVAVLAVGGVWLWLDQTMGDRNRGVTQIGAPAIGGAFTLVDHRGKTFTDADLRGRYALIYFGYTFCPDVCPTALSVISDAIDLLGPDGDTIVPIFITIDPARDTVDQLKAYVGNFHPRLVGLTGTTEQVAAAAKAYRVYFAKVRGKGDKENDDDYTMDHTSITYLMGPDGIFRAHFSHGTDAEAMARRLRELL